MHFEIIPAYEIPFAAQARVVNEAFAGYVGGWHDLDEMSLARFLHLQGAHLFYSRFIRDNTGFVGFGYINRTGLILRLAAMALAPRARGTGAADTLLKHLLGEARDRGDELITLEVIQQNPRAIAFYRRHGFSEVAQLFGWSCQRGGASQTDDQVTPIAVSKTLDLPRAWNYPAVPWPVSRHAVAKVERTIAFTLGNVALVLSEPAAGRMRINGIVAPSQSWAEIRRAIKAVAARFDDREFFVPPIWPEEFGRELFAPLGYERESISQFYMHLPLQAPMA